MTPLALRRLGRTIRRELSVLKYRLTAGKNAPARVVFRPARPAPPLEHPVIGVVPPPGLGPADLEAILARQTEDSLTILDEDNDSTPFFWAPSTGAGIEPCRMESLLIAAAALDVGVALGGRAAPGDAPGRPDDVDPTNLALLRRPRPGTGDHPVRGVLVPEITAETPTRPVAPAVHRSGPCLLGAEGGPGRVIRAPVTDVERRLAAIPAAPGPPAALFLLPYLAVGGAENLLFDLIGGLGDDRRILVVTLDPHRAELGQTVDRCRELTPHTYTLGDWAPREARIGALRHLIRRWSVGTLVSWNGTVDFYDHALELRRTSPGLRILTQLYNHRGGWFARTTRRHLRELDGHLAVNRPIAEALIARGAPAERVHLIHHGVRIPEPVPEELRLRRRTERRRELGLPEERIVVGTFIRLHRQKRPLDIIRLARRMAGTAFHFLLVGGGPEDDAVDAEIRRDPPPNLTRLPLHPDPTPLYDALDLCLMTSEYEGLPVFLLDGAVREIPCIATAVGEIPELLAEGGGRLIDRPGDLDAFETALRSLEEPEVRRREGAAARRRVVERFGLERSVENYRRVIFPETVPGEEDR